MSELRKDPVINRWVIISKERSARPTELNMERKHADHSFCPFCAGHEDKTPREIYADRPAGTEPNKEGWSVRVVPNKFPALRSDIKIQRYGIGMYDAVSGTGAHEVVVEHPEHLLNIADFSLDQVTRVLKVYRHRLIDLYKDKRFRYVMIFKNYGIPAGATISHPHSQIIALPVVPKSLKAELESARVHYLRKERCLFCDIIKQEQMSRERIIAETDHFLSFTPYSSQFPFQVTIIPKHHCHHFALESDETLMDLSRLLKDVLIRLKLALNDPSYNIILHTAPNIVERPGNSSYWSSLEYDYHWYLEIMPRLIRVAGFEWGTGFYINPTPPEEAADFLRNYIQVDSEE